MRTSKNTTFIESLRGQYFVSCNSLPNNCYGWNQHFWPRFFKHLPYSVVKAGLVKPIGYWAIPTSVGNTMLLMPSGYA